MGLSKVILDLLFPPKCAFCRSPLRSGEKGMCARCACSLPFIEGADRHMRGEFFEDCASPLRYAGRVRSSLLRFKFGGATANAEAYAPILADCIRTELAGKYDFITWVPLSKKRETDRGYDQSMLLAMAVALELGTVAVSMLRKDTDVPAQSSIRGREKRRANVADVYSVTDPELVNGRRILIIDDIVTTGATLSECARTLLTAGAASVCCAALARAENEGD